MSLDVKNLLQVEEKLTNLIKGSLAKEPNKIADISQFFPNTSKELLLKFSQRLCEERKIAPQQLFDATKAYIQKTGKLLTNMDKDDLVTIVTEIGAEKHIKPTSSHSPFERYAQNYLQLSISKVTKIVDSAKEKGLTPIEIYEDTNEFDRELAKVTKRKSEETKETFRKKRYLELANKELDLGNYFSSVAELKAAKQKAIEAGVAV